MSWGDVGEDWFGEGGLFHDSSRLDSRSHDKIRLVIGGQVIKDGHDDYGICAGGAG